jgi:hypothetical protein
MSREGKVKSPPSEDVLQRFGYLSYHPYIDTLCHDQ